MIKRYVAGFLFSEKGDYVALVEKQKPEWQKGKLNTIGGKIEEGESALHAIQREFREETGLDISDWTPFCVLKGDDSPYNESHISGEFEVHFFAHFSDQVFKVKTMEAEKVNFYATHTIFSLGKPIFFVPNLKWLIPMALERGLFAKVFEGIKV